MLFVVPFGSLFLSLRSDQLYRNARYDRTAMMVLFSFPCWTNLGVGHCLESCIVLANHVSASARLHPDRQVIGRATFPFFSITLLRRYIPERRTLSSFLLDLRLASDHPSQLAPIPLTSSAASQSPLSVTGPTDGNGKVEAVRKGCKVGAINANALQERIGSEWSSGCETSLRLCAKSSLREPFEMWFDFAFFLSHYIYSYQLLIGWLDKLGCVLFAVTATVGELIIFQKSRSG
ncbi:hypothetical protein VTN00DRAFT_1312 [Thermoascus crustaceus]|uniref:uncharacterized protein n=1 Tax=Thermoascus crustaceus TaxID=5088 RepID=UPI003743618C